MRDIETLQGVWRCISYEDAAGKKSPDHIKAMANLVIAGNDFSVKSDDYVWTAGFMAIDADLRPKAIDFIAACNGHVLGKQFAIYELNAASLFVCLASTGEDRPTRFCAGKGLHQALATWEKVPASYSL